MNKLKIDKVEFSDWQKLDLRVAEIKKIEDIAGADKLYKLEIDAGKEIGKKTICAGIKPYYTKEQLKNKKIIYFSNLKPRMLRGIESQGMLLAASTPKGVPRDISKEMSTKGKVVLISPEEEIEVGSRIG